MSGLNITLVYFIAVVAISACARALLAWQRPTWSFLAEFIAAFSLAASRLEVQTISEVGQWALGLGPDVTLTLLFLTLTVHAIIMQGVSGNPSVTAMRFLQKGDGGVSSLLSVAAQFSGAHLALILAGRYWAMELTDMHMLKNLMSSECSSSLRCPLVQGVFTEAVSALIFHLAQLGLECRSQLLRTPLLALLLTFLFYAGNNFTSAYVNPSLAYALTFTCPGHTFWEYLLVYWLGPLIGMALSLFLYMGNIPLLFTTNLLYSKKARFRLPKGRNSEEEKE
ncbi:aquaporin 12 [Brachyhypopomus gauderio]|uniref:aquaporin 12 n=1 Tax=Brachyhypopomus gauderio TaxID=698409 RepID=UPI0040436807